MLIIWYSYCYYHSTQNLFYHKIQLIDISFHQGFAFKMIDNVNLAASEKAVVFK